MLELRLLITADIDKRNKASEKALLSCGFTLLDAVSSRYIICNRSVNKSNL